MSGVPYQRRPGIESFFRGIFRAVWPTIKKLGITAGKEAIQAGSEATRDYLNEGVDFKTAMKQRGKQALGRTVSRLGQRMQEGRGVEHRVVRNIIKGFKRKQKQKKDIFHG